MTTDEVLKSLGNLIPKEEIEKMKANLELTKEVSIWLGTQAMGWTNNPDLAIEALMRASAQIAATTNMPSDLYAICLQLAAEEFNRLLDIQKMANTSVNVPKGKVKEFLDKMKDKPITEKKASNSSILVDDHSTPGIENKGGGN